MDENLRQRATRKLLRVTMPDGKVICYKSATMTLIDALVAIGEENFSKITTENCHLPLLSKEIYPRYKDYMKPVCNGWYVNAQSDTQQKYMQLISIRTQLGLQMEVEVGTDFETSDEKVIQKQKKKDDKLLVKFPSGEYAAGENPIDTLIDAIWQIGPEIIQRKELMFKNKNIITPIKKYNGQVQVGENMWLTVPNSTKDKYKMLRIIDAMLRLRLEITII
ncbi:MAG: hypothetical protein IKH22_08195 [Prevotella sp.]|nr:hypothetical protein [Prevotella sp.]